MQSWKFFMYSSALDKISIHLISSMLWNLVGGAKEAGCTQMEGGANLTFAKWVKILYEGELWQYRSFIDLEMWNASNWWIRLFDPISLRSPKPHGWQLPKLVAPALWQYGLRSFQTGGTKLERFLPKNQHTLRKLLNFENWVNGEESKIGHHFKK